MQELHGSCGYEITRHFTTLTDHQADIKTKACKRQRIGPDPHRAGHLSKYIDIQAAGPDAHMQAFAKSLRFARNETRSEDQRFITGLCQSAMGQTLEFVRGVTEAALRVCGNFAVR